MRMLSLLWPRGDGRLVFLYVLLVLFGLAMLWSVTEPLRGHLYAEMQVDVPKGYFWRQLLFAGFSWLVVCLVSRVSLRHLEHIAWPGYFGAVVLLGLVLALAPEVGGSRRWIGLGSLRIQPSEFAKIALVILLAAWMAQRLKDRSSVLAIVGSLTLTLIPAVLVMRQPDLGTSMVFLVIWLGMVFWFGISGILLFACLSAAASSVIMFYSEFSFYSGAEIKPQQAWPWGVYMLLLMSYLYTTRRNLSASITVLVFNIVAGVGIPLVWDRLQAYQKERILTFFDPTRDAWGAGYQAIQSKVAIGSGGFFGTQYLQGTQKGLAFLPERHTDFIFSVTGEELGLVGAILLLALFLMLVLRAMDIALQVRRPFGSLLAVGVASYFVFHVVVNVSITTGLFPVTGLPLPLISYGGSNFLVSSLMVALLLNLSVHRYDD